MKRAKRLLDHLRARGFQPHLRKRQVELENWRGRLTRREKILLKADYRKVRDLLVVEAGLRILPDAPCSHKRTAWVEDGPRWWQLCRDCHPWVAQRFPEEFLDQYLEELTTMTERDLARDDPINTGASTPQKRVEVPNPDSVISSRKSAAPEDGTTADPPGRHCDLCGIRLPQGDIDAGLEVCFWCDPPWEG